MTTRRFFIPNFFVAGGIRKGWTESLSTFGANLPSLSIQTRLAHRHEPRDGPWGEKVQFITPFPPHSFTFNSSLIIYFNSWFSIILRAIFLIAIV